MKLFLLENESSIDCLVESSAYALGVDVILCFNYLVVVKLKRLSARHLFAFCEDILTATDYDEIHAIADKIDLNWYKFDAEDLTIYQGISFGHLVRGVLSRKYMLPVLIKYGEIIRKALLRWPACNQIVYDLSFKGISGYKILEEHSQAFDKKLLVIEVCRQLNVNAEFFPPLFQLRASINSSSSPSGLASVLMSHMKRLIRVLATFVLNLFGCVVYKFCSGKSIYFPNYFNQISVLQHLSRRFVLRSIAPAISIRGLRYADFDSAHYIPSKADRNFEERLRAVMVRIANDNSSLYSFNDIDYKEVYYKGISDTILRVIPQMVMYLGKVRKVLRQYRIGIVIDAGMVDEKSKAVHEATKLEGAKTVFVDHGIQSRGRTMQALRLDEPDIVIGPGSFDPYGLRAPRVLLGNPSMDPYPTQNRKCIKSIKRVLFLTFEDGFYASLDRFAYKEKYFEGIFSIFHDLIDSEIEIYFKPHPSESREYFEYLFAFFGLNRSSINYVEGLTKFSDIIYSMDLVVSNLSNCYYESLAAGVPTVFFEPHFIKDAFCPPLNGIHGKDVLRFESGSALLSFIKQYQIDPAYLNQFVTNVLGNQSHLYFGQLDGLAGKRIVDYVSSLDC